MMKIPICLPVLISSADSPVISAVFTVTSFPAYNGQTNILLQATGNVS